jgi:hypothetical protein
VLAVSLLVVRELAPHVKQRPEVLPELLLRCLELLHIRHQREPLPGKRINLFAHDVGSGRLQRSQECLGFRPQAVNVLLVTHQLFVQTLHLGQTLLNRDFVVSPRFEGNFCRDSVLHALHLRTHFNTLK